MLRRGRVRFSHRDERTDSRGARVDDSLKVIGSRLSVGLNAGSRDLPESGFRIHLVELEVPSEQFVIRSTEEEFRTVRGELEAEDRLRNRFLLGRRVKEWVLLKAGDSRECQPEELQIALAFAESRHPHEATHSIDGVFTKRVRYGSGRREGLISDLNACNRNRLSEDGACDRTAISILDREVPLFGFRSRGLGSIELVLLCTGGNVAINTGHP